MTMESYIKGVINLPKSTFLNLPEDKRERIIEAAIDEFAYYTYHKASITRIVNNAGIPKGSFYQYFDDKKDLFKYIIGISSYEKMKYLNGFLKSINEFSFFTTIRDLYIAGIKFAKENPKLAAIGNDFVKNDNSKLKEEIMGTNISKSNEFFENLLKQGVETGEINSQIDIELTAHMFTTTSVSISEYFLKEIKSEDDMEIMKLVDEMLYIFKNGIKNRRED